MGDVIALNPTMTVLGFDVSLRRTGWATLDYDNGKLLDCGTIEPSPRLTTVESIASISTQVTGVISQCENRGGVDVAIEEGIAYRSGRTTRVLAMAWAAVALSTWDRLGIEPYEVNTSEVKKAATGEGNASKGRVTNAAVGKWDVRADDPDIADACWVAEVCRLHMHARFPEGAA